MKKTEECSHCGAEAKVVRGSYDFTESGLKNVRLRGIEMVQCDRCGNVDPIISRMADLLRVLAQSVAFKPYRLTGDDVKYLRKHLRMTAEQFSRLLHVDRVTLSKWENNEDKIGAQSDRLIRLIVLAKDPALRQTVKEAVDQFEKIKDSRRAVHIDIDTEKHSYQYA